MAQAIIVALPYISAALSVVSLALTLAMGTPKQKDSGANIDRKGSDNPKIVPFGNCMVPAIRVWNNVNNNNSSYLAQSYSMGVGQLNNIKEIYVDGVPCFKDHVPSFNKWYNYGSFDEFPNLSLGVRAGLDTEEAWPNMIEHGDGEYTETSRGDRTGSINMLIERWVPSGSDNDIRIMSDRIQVEALVEGNPVIDPRYDTALAGVSDTSKRQWINVSSLSYRNPACVLFTYLVDDYYGVGIPADAIDVDSFIELANYCEANEIYFDGYIDQNNDFGQILLDMATSFDGVIYVEDGSIKVKADKPTIATAHITEDDLVGTFKLSNANDSSYFNVVSAEFINIDSNYSGDKFVLPANVLEDEQIKVDGFQKSKTIKYPFTTDNSEHRVIKKFANKALKQAKFQKSIEFELDNTKQIVQIHDVIEVSNEAYKLDRVKFRVTKVATSLDDKVMISKVSATEYSETVYDESSYEDGVTSGKPSIPSAIIPTPVSLAFNQIGFGKTGKGVLSWTTRYNREHRTIVEYKLKSASDWKRVGEVRAEKFEFEGLRSDSYDFRVMTISYLGSTSDWTVLNNVVVTGADALPPVSDLTATFTGTDCLVNWSYDKTVELEVDTVGDLFSHYEVIVYKGANNTYAETITTLDNHLNYTLDSNIKSGLNRDLRFEVKVVSIHSVLSASTIVDAFNPQIEQPSGVDVSGKLVQLTVKWNDPKESVSDYSGSEIHISSNGNFTPSASTLVTTTSTPINQLTGDYKTTHYVRAGHYDVFGRDGIAYSAAIPFTTLDIDDMLSDSPAWGDVNDSLVNLDKVTGEINAAIDKVEEAVGNIETNIGQVEDSIAKAEADIKANATSINSVSNTVGSQGALISQNAEAIQSNAGNLVSYKSEVTAEFKGVKASISSNSTSIADANQALNSYKEEVTGKFEESESKITQAQTTANTANNAIAALDSKLTAELNSAKASISNNSTAIAEVDKTLTSYKTEVAGKFKDAESKINQAQTTANSATEALASYKTEVSGKFKESDSKITNAQNTANTANSAVAALDSKVTAELNSAKASIAANSIAISDTDKALAAYKSEVASSFESANSSISQAQSTANSATQSVASLDTRLSAEINGVKGSIAHTDTVVAGVDGKVNALNQTMITVDGKTSGLIMGNNGSVSTTDVIADRFRISAGANTQAVFEVSGDNVMMRNALIKNLTASNISGGAITGDKISSNTKVTAGSGTKSASLDGHNGHWRIYAGHSDGGSAPFRVGKDGDLVASNANIQGNVNATSGTIGGCSINNGVLNVPSANITGKLTANQIETDSLVLKGQAMTIRKYWQTPSITLDPDSYKHFATITLDYPADVTADAKLAIQIIAGGSHSGRHRITGHTPPSRFECTPIHLLVRVNGKDYSQAIDATTVVNYLDVDHGSDGNANVYASVGSYALNVNTAFIVSPNKGVNTIEVFSYGKFYGPNISTTAHTLKNVTITVDGGVAA